jgi:hypothetical protein
VRTRMTILSIVTAVALVAVGCLVVLLVTLGPWLGLGVAAAVSAAVLAVYLLAIRPWHLRWGASDEEVRRTMPGDELLEGAASTTRAITVAAPPERIWPWLAQIGYGRAGWYSYDWIDNDGRPSASEILPDFQDLWVGDRILMAPGMGSTVRAVEPNRYVLSASDGGETWCLALYPLDERHTRLVSRWRAKWPLTAATLFWTFVVDPGFFIMERKMLEGIRARAEHHRLLGFGVPTR